VKHAAEIKITPGIGVVRSTGTLPVTPQLPTTYKLTAKGADGPSKIAAVTLQVISPPAIQDFSASRTSIKSGQAAVLQWTVTGAEQVSINQGIGGVEPQGTRRVFPRVSKSYTLQASGPGGSVSRSIAVIVTYQGNLKIERFSADPDVIDPGGTAVLRWDVRNATEVRIDPGIGRVEAAGWFRVSPRNTTEYRMYASSQGTVFKDVIVTVRR
jgi:hypothetical protein